MSNEISRLWKHIQDRKPFGMISFSRHQMTAGEKINAFITLKQKVKEIGYGMIELKGGFIANNDEEKPVSDFVGELSLMVPDITKNDLIKLGMKDLGYGHQDVVLYCDGVNFLGFITPNPNKSKIMDVEFEYGKDKDVLQVGKEAVSQYFSILFEDVNSSRKFNYNCKQMENFILYEMRDRRSPKNPNGDWWDNFGMRIN